MKSKPLKERFLDQVALWLPYQHSTTISGWDIAKELRCTQAIIYYHWASMDELMCEAMEVLKDRDREGWDRAVLRERLCSKSLVNRYLKSEGF